jgi:two-component system response regulator
MPNLESRDAGGAAGLERKVRSMVPLVLFVDDDEGFLDLAKRAVARSGVPTEARCFRDGEDALRFLGLRSGWVGPPENLVAVFADLKLPGVTGWEILRRVRDNVMTRRLPVVIVSASGRPDDVRLSYELGANSYLVKHPDPDAPARRLREAICYWCESNRVPWTSGAAV